MKVNVYSEDMAYADSSDIKNKTNNFLFRKLNQFGTILKIDSVTDLKLQYSGIDKMVVFQNGKLFKIEEKVRKKDWGDILIELIADNRYASYDYLSNNFEYNKLRGVGWGMKDYTTDLLLYYFEETDTGHLISWKKFQYIFKEMLPVWYQKALNKEKGFGLKIAKNTDYESVNIAIPSKVFFDCYINAGGKII